jgi:hypothetical protein
MEIADNEIEDEEYGKYDFVFHKKPMSFQR